MYEMKVHIAPMQVYLLTWYIND